MVSSIDGLVSGLSTSSMITSLMQVEAAPQTRLKSKVSLAETVVASYQSVNSKVNALKTAADGLGQLSTWRGIKPTVSSTSVTATSAGGTDTLTGAVEFSVKGIAKAQSSTMRVDTSTSVDPNDSTKTIAATLNVPDKLYVTVGKDDGLGNITGTPVEIDVSADKTAKGIQAALNGAGLGIKASLVKVDNNQSVLQFNGTKTGEDFAFSITGLEDADFDGNNITTTMKAASASIEVGGGNNTPGGYTLTSSNNTFTGLMPGVTLTVSKLEDNITLTSASDVSGIAAKFQAMIDAANDTLTEVGAQTAYDAATKKGSPLTGDFNVRQMGQSILSAISQGQKDIGSLSKIGVALDSTGKLTFDAAKFTAAYSADPATIQKAGIAFADTFENLAIKQSSNLTSSITGRKNDIDSLNVQIDNWDIRLVAKRESLQKTYTGLETALSKLQSQSTWLSGQIASLG